MNLLDRVLRRAVSRVGARWLKRELAARGVSIRITAPCLRDFVLDADRAASLQASGTTGVPYRFHCARRLPLAQSSCASGFCRMSASIQTMAITFGWQNLRAYTRCRDLGD